jgi:hypothetical protein
LTEASRVAPDNYAVVFALALLRLVLRKAYERFPANRELLLGLASLSSNSGDRSSAVGMRYTPLRTYHSQSAAVPYWRDPQRILFASAHKQRVRAVG